MKYYAFLWAWEYNIMALVSRFENFYLSPSNRSVCAGIRIENETIVESRSKIIAVAKYFRLKIFERFDHLITIYINMYRSVCIYIYIYVYIYIYNWNNIEPLSFFKQFVFCSQFKTKKRNKLHVLTK